MTPLLKISGFIDYSEKENRLFFLWKKRLEHVFSSFGFMGFNPRPVESIAALQTKGGIAHQIYTLGRLQDGTMTDLALPFDRTIPMAIYIAAHRHELVYPFKRFDISHSFRGERPQAGRARGFIQADIDIVDQELSTLSEMECLAALITALDSLEIPPFTIYLNHISIPKALIERMGFSSELLPEALRIVDKMDKIGFEKAQEQLKALLPTSDLSWLDFFSFKGSFSEFQKKAPSWVVALPGFIELQDTFLFLTDTFPKENLFSFCPGMVRGLDYYTGLVFETFLQDHPEFGSVASGGRYNKLIDSIINETTNLEGFGISIGLTRLFDVLKKQDLLPPTPSPQSSVLVAYREINQQKEAFTIANRLRKHGILVDLYLGRGNIGKQLSYANKKEIPYVFMLMGNTYVIKDLEKGTQTEDISSLEQAIEKVLSFPIFRNAAREV